MEVNHPWSRIPPPVDSEADRRALVSILASAGLEVRIVKARSGASKSAPYKRYVEYREAP